VTFYLIPTGLSILDNLAKEVGEPHDWDIAPTDPGWVAQRLRDSAETYAYGDERPENVAASWRTEFADHAEDLDIAAWDPVVSAETSTLAARRREAAGGPAPTLLGADDTAVLLASQTPEGMCAALLVATMLAGGDPGRVDVAETPAVPTASATRAPAGSYQMHAGRVAVVRVTGLAPQVDGGFTLATFGIGDVMRAVRLAAAMVPAGPGRLIDVQLTGGYKAVLLYTMALAEILRSTVHEDGIDVSACYLFEQPGAQTPRIPPTLNEIGLRLFSPTFCHTAALALSAVHRGRRPQSGDLDGVAWETRGRQRRLNALGYGYLALLGLRTNVGTEGDMYGG
jgi:hypothetical protein